MRCPRKISGIETGSPRSRNGTSERELPGRAVVGPLGSTEIGSRANGSPEVGPGMSGLNDFGTGTSGGTCGERCVSGSPSIGRGPNAGSS